MGSLGEIVKKMYWSLDEGDAKNGGLNSFTYVSPPEWECTPLPGIKQPTIKNYVDFPNIGCLRTIKMIAM